MSVNAAADSCADRQDIGLCIRCRGCDRVAMSSDLRWGRRYLMCPPTYFDVSYAINPWMDLTIPVDRELAQRQWDALVATYLDAGAEIEVLTPQPGLPDLVFTANLGIV